LFSVKEFFQQSGKRGLGARKFQKYFKKKDAGGGGIDL
jgi:hypothetical protein